MSKTSTEHDKEPPHTIQKMKESGVLITDDESDAIVLNAKPISLRRSISIKKGPGGIPMIREIIVIETEASIGRIATLLLSILIYALVFQIIISVWQKYHSKSCKIAVTALLFLFPPLLLLFLGDYIFFVLSVLFMTLVGRTIIDIVRRPMRKNVPQKTYRIYRLLYRITYAFTCVAQGILLIGFFTNSSSILAFSLAMLLPALYFGLLTRESIEFISERMAINVGYYSKEGVPPKKIERNVCGVCDDNLQTQTVTLNCKHSFHDECIKGWLFMGKKGFCPCCRENVDFGNIKLDILERGENLYSNFIDLLREAIVFVAFFMVLGMFYKLNRK